MGISAFYNSAKNYAAKIKRERPGMVSEKDSCLCLIVNNNREVMTGITSVKVIKGKLETVHAEQNAITAMIADHRTNAKQMIVLSFEDFSICTPCEDCLDMLNKANVENSECKIVIGENELSTVRELLDKSDELMDDLTVELDDEVPAPKNEPVKKTAAPMEFVAGFEFDDDNPFAAPKKPAEEKSEPVKPKFLYETPEVEEPDIVEDNPDEQAKEQSSMESVEQTAAVEEQENNSSEPNAEAEVVQASDTEQALSEEGQTGELSESDRPHTVKKFAASTAPVSNEPLPTGGDDEEEEEEEEEFLLFKDESRMRPEPKGDVGNRNIEEKGLSKRELLKLAKQRKKQAKQNARNR